MSNENQDERKQVETAGWRHAQQAEDAEKSNQLFWILHPYIHNEYINQQISGNPNKDWLAWFKETYAKEPFKKGLSLGSGSGNVERKAIKLGICSSIDAFEISTQAVELAKQLAKEEQVDNIQYYVQDLNKIELKKNYYDLIIVSHALHHIQELNHIFAEMRKSLQPNGLILINEYVGPSRFQFPEKQSKLINYLLHIIPQKYRRDLSQPARVGYIEDFIPPSVEYMKQVDPSEAVRSDEIIPIFKKYFTVLAQQDYGGTLLQFLLSKIAGNFDEKKEQDRIILQLLCFFESILIREKVLSSDFSLLVGKTKKRSWFGLFSP